MKRQILKISPDGTVVFGPHNDMFVDFGKQNIVRASEVEFCQEIGRWTVTMIYGPQCCLVQTFDRRSDALSAEIDYINSQLVQGVYDDTTKTCFQ
jgi:hypothetical protein